MTTDEIRARVSDIQRKHQSVVSENWYYVPKTEMEYLCSTINALLQCDEVMLSAINKIRAHDPTSGQKEYWDELSKEELIDGLSYDGTTASTALAERDKILNEVKG